MADCANALVKFTHQFSMFLSVDSLHTVTHFNLTVLQFGSVSVLCTYSTSISNTFIDDMGHHYDQIL